MDDYTEFIKSALDAGFTDEQADWLWENVQRERQLPNG